jgi:1-acyl-sn-glycerol-3-phosphate acyltransferase
VSDTLRPRPEQLAVLTRFERFAFDIAETINAKPPLKRAAHTFLKTVGAWWVKTCTNSLLHVQGLEHLQNLKRDRGVIIVSNHRSFFDLYVMSSVLLRNTNWVTGMYFPVRGEYFYERPDGIAVNAVMSAWAMYPPVMRRPEARAFNEFTVDLMAEILKQPGNVVGMHPEGTRNKTDDPYTLLPAQIGIGQMVHRSRPIVVPMFVLGLGNDFTKQVKGNFDGTGDPITLMFGPPVDFGTLLEEPARLRTYKKITDRLRDVLTDLGQQERAWREREGFPSLAPKPRGEHSNRA